MVNQVEEFQKLKEELESVWRHLGEKEAGTVKVRPKPAPRKPSTNPNTGAAQALPSRIV